MLSVEFTIAQGAKKTSATLAGQDRLFLRMVETTGFAFDHDGFATLANVSAAKQGGENFYLQWHAASRAG
jgi:hypothetical protein